MDSAAKAWADPDAFALTLITLGLDRFATPDRPAGPLEWLPETWRQEGADEFRTDPDPTAFARLSAALTALQAPHEWTDHEASFLDLARALTGMGWDGAAAHAPTTEELAWAVVEGALIGLPGDFSPAVARLVNMTARRDGHPKLPELFPEYGIPVDRTVWAAGPAPGPDDAPDLVAAYEAGRDAKAGDLDAFVRGQIKELADQLAALPLVRLTAKTRAVAAALARTAETNPVR